MRRRSQPPRVIMEGPVANITKIRLHIQTMEVSDAGADGPLYLGFRGRELSVDSAGDDLERGSIGNYTFGQDHNVSHADLNDPRSPQLRVEDIARYPVYLRFANTDDHWKLSEATVRLNDHAFAQWDTRDRINPDEGIWLGPTAGMNLHIPVHEA